MKRRNRFGRHRMHSPRLGAWGFSGEQRKRGPKARSFEQLEDRFCFSVSPVQTYGISNDTAEGAAALWLREMQWAMAQEATVNYGSDVGQNVSMALPNDPLFTSQWHLLNTGQEVGNPDFQQIFGVAGEDINVVPAWDLGYTGEGVLVAVMDSGVQLTHPDLAANIHPTLRFNAITGTGNAQPNLFDPEGPHGTAVAGLVGAVANNGVGGSGVAPGATIVPVRLFGGLVGRVPFAEAVNYVTQNGIDITSNSWGPPQPIFDRTIFPMSAAEIATLRDSILFGRDGLGIIHVFASGNSGGPAFNPGFQTIGNWDSSVYDGYANSRYVITVGGVDHDGQYSNVDGTFTAYPEAGANLLVVAPTGSNAALNIGDDNGLGSGMWTTDLMEDFGYNAEPLPSGFDPDRDFLADPNYTSRFNGTSAATPLVSGVIALMLEANPNLSYRDVQEILVRSARQNAQFEVPASGGIPGTSVERPLVSTWQTNQINPFRDPDPWNFLDPPDPFLAVYDPTADPNIEGGLIVGIPGFPTRASFAHYESLPGVYTNGAGYTVSQGYGVYSEMVGYGHGVVDAGLAVQMAEQWHTLSQNLPPERTYSTFVVQPGPQTGYTFPAAEKMDNDNGAMIVPGGIGGIGGFIDYWDEYFADDDPADPDDGPFSGDDPPGNSRGFSYWEFEVPDDKSINVEWAEVKVSLDGGGPDDIDFIKMSLVSPDGTVSELNHYYADPEVVAGTYSFQQASIPAGHLNPNGDVGNGGNFVWTFSTNRSWGESTKTKFITDPTTGEPLMERDFLGQPLAPYERGWELHMENWSNTDYRIAAVEIIWHGKPIEENAQRVQGFVGIDTNSDEVFNYTRGNLVLFDSDFDPGVIRSTEFQSTLDLNQEPFAANVMVEAFRITNGVAEDDPIATFLTGHDGNYYFDLVPGDYLIRATDPQDRVILEDSTTDAQFRQHFRQEWVINADWFFAAERDLPTQTPVVPTDPLQLPFDEYRLGEIFYDAATNAPQKFEYMGPTGGPQNVPSGIQNLNFLLKQDAQPDEIVVNGTVYADLNGDGTFNGDDAAVGGVIVYQDVNRNGVRDSGEQSVVTSDDPAKVGQYTMTFFADHTDTYAIGVVPPSVKWIPTNPSDGVIEIFAGPGAVLNNLNFHLLPEQGAIPDPGEDEPGEIIGLVFVDVNENGSRDIGDAGVPGFRVYIDANENGAFDAGEQFAISGSNGSYVLSDVAPGLHRIEIEIENEGTEDASWRLTVPTAGFREVNLGPGETFRILPFGVGNRANRDWGDLPSSYITRSGDGGAGGPSHIVVPGFRMGETIDGEVNGTPTPGADGDDAVGNDEDGVTIVTNSGSLQAGANVLQFELVGVGGYLNGWIDINGDGNFDAGEQVITNVDLNPGNRQLTINLPGDAATGPLAARFRWGENGLGATGPAGIGEVEDYYLPNSIVPSVVLTGDYDLSGTVDEDDRALWRATFGSTSDLRADGNNDGTVDLADFVVWRNNLGATGGTGASAGGNLNHALLGLPVVTQSSSTIAAGGHVSQGRLALVPQVSDESVESVAAQTSLLVGLPLSSPVAILSDGASSDVIGSAAVVDATDSSLLLLDRVLAELDGDNDQHADDVWCNTGGDDESVSDMALAAVLDDAWWGSL